MLRQLKLKEKENTTLKGKMELPSAKETHTSSTSPWVSMAKGESMLIKIHKLLKIKHTIWISTTSTIPRIQRPLPRTTRDLREWFQVSRIGKAFLLGTLARPGTCNSTISIIRLLSKQGLSQPRDREASWEAHRTRSRASLPLSRDTMSHKANTSTKSATKRRLLWDLAALSTWNSSLQASWDREGQLPTNIKRMLGGISRNNQLLRYGGAEESLFIISI